MGFIHRDFLNKSSGSSTSNQSFRVLQWNVLAQGLTYSTQTDNFCKVDPSHLTWEHRNKLIAEHLSSLNADIICLQEVDHFDDFFAPLLVPQGYKGYYAPKLHSPCFNYTENNGPDGVALFYKRDRYTLKDLVITYLKKENGAGGNQALILALLFDTTTNCDIIVGVTHLKAKTGFESRRLVQMNSCIEAFNTMSKSFKNSSLIFCGDFNSEETESCHQALKDSTLQLHDAYKDLMQDVPYEFTTWKCRPNSEKKQIIDNVFYNSSTFKASDALKLPKDEDVALTRFPSHDHPSDHLSLCVDFSFNQ